MKYEVEAACFYWLSCLDRSKIQSDQESKFVDTLQELMKLKFANHWYDQNPLQGQGLRSMICCTRKGHVDVLLLDSAESALFDFYSVFNGKDCRMWIDPSEVEVEYTQAPKTRTKLYSNTGTNNYTQDELLGYSTYPNQYDRALYYPSQASYDHSYPDYNASDMSQHGYDQTGWNSYPTLTYPSTQTFGQSESFSLLA